MHSEEILDIVDEFGEPTGRTVARSEAHRAGIRHRTSHVWLLRYRTGENGEKILQVLLQKRCMQKDSFPGCYDISSAGHIPAGQDFLPSAVRELREELGIDADPTEFILCGRRHFSFTRMFRGETFYDNQVSNIYLLWRDLPESAFTPQPEEVEEVRWFDFENALRGAEDKSFPNCIYPEELKMVLEHV